MSYMTISSQEKHNFPLCSCFHAHPTTLLLNNIGGTNAWAVPPPQILGGTVPPVPPRSPPLQVSTRTHSCTHTNKQTNAHMHTHIHTHMCTHMHTHIYTHLHTPTHIHTHRVVNCVVFWFIANMDDRTYPFIHCKMNILCRGAITDVCLLIEKNESTTHGIAFQWLDLKW